MSLFGTLFTKMTFISLNVDIFVPELSSTNAGGCRNVCSLRAGIQRLSENAHLLRYPHPSSLRRTAMYASFLGISEALYLGIFKQPL